MTQEQESGSVGAVADVDATTPPAPGADVQKPIPPEGEAPPENAAETTEQKDVREKSKFQRRLDRHKAATVEAKTEARLLRERLEKLEAQSKQSQEPGAPKREDFEDYAEYVRAAAKFDATEATKATLKADRDAREGKERQQQASAGTENVAKAWAESEKSVQAAHKDYDAVVGAFTDEGGELESLSKQARMAIAELGPALLYHLAKNPDEAERIAELSPVRQVAELGKLEAKVSVAPKKTTNAPAPASTTTGGRTSTTDLSKMTQDEYEAHRKSHGARWAR